MNQFKLTREQRQRLLAGSYEPLDFEQDPKLEPGDRYVLKEMTGQPSWEPGYGVRAPKVPVWWLTVTAVQRHRRGFWRVRFDVTDLRDSDLFLKRYGGYTAFDELQAGAVPDREWLELRTKTVREFWHQERLARFARERRERGRAQGRRAA